MNNKLYYIANIRLPTEKAHGIQIMEMCEAFASIGHKVELIIPTRDTPITDEVFSYYDIDHTFVIKKLWCINAVRFGKVGFLLQSLSFTFSSSAYLLFKKGIMYTRDSHIAFVLKFFGKKAIWEAHMGHENFFIRHIVKSKNPFIVITKGLKDLYIKMGMTESNIWVAPDGVDASKFNISDTKEAARKKLGFGVGEKIILYAGHLFSWKGADAFAQSAEFLPKDISLVFVGGTESDIASFKEKYSHFSNVKILGKKPHNEIPLYLRSADVLVIPNSAKEDISRLYTSPMKLFEYIASGTPVIASDMPSIREILNDSNSYFFTSDNPKSLADAILSVFGDYSTALKRAHQAKEDSLRYSWYKRAEDILSFVEKTGKVHN